MKNAHFVTLAVAAISAGSFAAAENVEITLVDELDGKLNSYCLDIKGGGPDVDPADGLQAHTCYSYRGDLGRDQIFDTAQFADSTLYMPQFDVCVALSGLTNGSEIKLEDCDGGPLQKMKVGNDGTIRPVNASDLCFTVSNETRHGRNPEHLIRSLSLAECSDDLASVQKWRTRTTDD